MNEIEYNAWIKFVPHIKIEHAIYIIAVENCKWKFYFFFDNHEERYAKANGNK